MYLICNVGCDDRTCTEIDLSPYEYRVLEKFALENNKNATYQCKPHIEIYSEYQKDDDYYYFYKEKDNLISREE